MNVKEWENRLRPTIESNVSLVRSYLKKGDTFIDVGGNSGLFTQMIIDGVGVDYLENIVIFEPIPYLFNECKIKFNTLPNVKVLELALSDETQKTTILASHQNFGYNKIFKEGMEIHSHEKYTIDCIIFSDWIKTTQLTKVDFIKIDAEGHDVNVIYGMFEWLETTDNRPKILFEKDWYQDLEQKLLKDICDKFKYNSIQLERDVLLIP